MSRYLWDLAEKNFGNNEHGGVPMSRGLWEHLNRIATLEEYKILAEQRLIRWDEQISLMSKQAIAIIETAKRKKPARKGRK